MNWTKTRIIKSNAIRVDIIGIVIEWNWICTLGRVSFEKLTDMDYQGNTYYTIRNLSLYECQGWCREEPDCAAASFR